MIIFPASCCRVQYYAASGFLTITYTLMHANFYYFHLTLPKPKGNLCVILRTLILWLCWIRWTEESGAYVLYATCDVLLSITFLDYYLTLALKTTNSHQDLKTSYGFSQIYQIYAKKLYFLDLGRMCFYVTLQIKFLPWVCLREYSDSSLSNTWERSKHQTQVVMLAKASLQYLFSNKNTRRRQG